MDSQAAADHLEPWLDLRGKVVLVTGASSGLGRDFCLDLAKAGCRIIAAARRVDRLNSLCDQINNVVSSPQSSSFSSQSSSFSSSSSADDDDDGSRRSTVRAVAVELDVCADGPTIEKSVQKAWDAFGRIDALVNNAGIRGNVRSPLDLSEEEWNKVLRTNLTGTWLVSKFICKRMREAGRGGSVINVSSITGVGRGQLPGAAAYASSKAGLNTLTQVMAVELGKHKIRVNAISPGIFKSEITENLIKKAWLSDVAARIIPLKEHGTSDPALTSLVRYLIHDSSVYVSGNVFIVDAGATLPGIPIFSSL